MLDVADNIHRYYNWCKSWANYCDFLQEMYNKYCAVKSHSNVNSYKFTASQNYASRWWSRYISSTQVSTTKLKN